MKSTAIVVLLLVQTLALNAQISFDKQYFLDLVNATHIEKEYELVNPLFLNFGQTSDQAQVWNYAELPDDSIMGVQSYTWLHADEAMGSEAFSGADIAQYTSFNADGVLVEFSAFFSIDDDGLYRKGLYSKTSSGLLSFSRASYFFPESKIFAFPLAMGQNTTYTDTLTEYEGAEITNQTITKRVTRVDAFGSMMIPGHDVKSVLRVVTDEIEHFTSFESGDEPERERSLTVSFYYSGGIIEFDIQDTTWTSGATEINDYRIIVFNETSTPIEPEPTVPQKFKLNQNYPNPFNPITTVTYDLHKSGMVQLSVFDMLGREVWNDGPARIQTAGTHTVQIDARNLSTGTYIYRLQLDGQQQLRKMTVIK